MERLEVAIGVFAVVLLSEILITFRNPKNEIIKTYLSRKENTESANTKFRRFSKHHYNCTKKCSFTEIQNTPDFNDRKKLTPIIPDRRSFTRNESRVILFTTDLSENDQSNYLREAENYISDFWESQIDIKIPEYPKSQTTVPELYHYTWFSCHEFKFINFVSMISVLNNFASTNAKIIFHTDCEPVESKFWLEFKTIVKNLESDCLIIQNIQLFTKVWSHTLVHVEHVSDVYRILLLSKFGGIYCDDDIVFLKSHQQLFDTKIPIMGDAQTATIANGFIITPANPKIFLKWLIEYKEYKPVKENWDWFSVRKIWSLWRMYPDEIKVLDGKLVRPGAMELDMIFSGFYDWRESFNVHIYKRNFGKYDLQVNDFGDIDCLENSIGEILRHAVYGERKVC